MACKVASGKGSAPMSFRHASNAQASSYRVSPCSYYVAGNFFPFVTDRSPPIFSLTFQIQGLIDSSFFSSLESLFPRSSCFSFGFPFFFSSSFFSFLEILVGSRLKICSTRWCYLVIRERMLNVKTVVIMIDFKTPARSLMICVNKFARSRYAKIIVDTCMF